MSEEVKEIIYWLSKLIATPSFSKEEDATALVLEEMLRSKGYAVERKGNNVWTKNPGFHSDKDTFLLCSHHDTVKPNPGYTRDPFDAALEGDKLYGLGSNDAGASLISLFFLFHEFAQRELPFNLVWLAAAEEEISGTGGVTSVLPSLPKLKLGIVGEPTGKKVASSERGLLVIDARVEGKAGHAARKEGINSINESLNDLLWLSEGSRHFKESPLLGPVTTTVTQVRAGEQSNVVPALCEFVIDVRVNDLYRLEEVLEILENNLTAQLKARSIRLRPSFLATDHPLFIALKACGLENYGSPTLSDMALIPCPCLKMGPGESSRSHSADEFVLLSEIEWTRKRYTDLFKHTIVEYQTQLDNEALAKGK